VRACILSVGDELILGQCVDTNAAWLSGQLADASVPTVEHRTVPDDRAAIAGAIEDLARRGELLLVTGGLGPTDDDLTRDALGDVLDPGRPLVRDEAGERTLRAWFARSATGMPEGNLRQADRPATMRLVPNPNGTAPGLAGEHGGCSVFALPGPPRENRPMFETHVRPVLPADDGGERLLTETVHQIGLGESRAAERLGDLTARDRNPLVGTTFSSGIVTARILARGDAREAQRRLEETVARVEAAWAPFCFGRGEVTLAEATGRALADAGRTLVTAESCTGGGLGKMIVDAAGASAYYRGGWVTYADDMKTARLDVDPALIVAHGAVSAPVARAMAEGARRRGDADDCLAITGVAGPGAAPPRGDEPGKPAGLVFIALARRGADGADEVQVRRFRFRGDRDAVRAASARSALQMLRLALTGHGAAGPLLWERPSEPREGRA
jgi:nicotinamide-nucleotide amidase